MNAYFLTNLALVSGWVWGSLVAVVIVTFFVLMVVALRRAFRNVDQIEGLDTHAGSPLSLRSSPSLPATTGDTLPLTSEGPSPEDLLPITDEIPIPKIQPALNQSPQPVSLSEAETMPASAEPMAYVPTAPVPVGFHNLPTTTADMAAPVTEPLSAGYTTGSLEEDIETTEENVIEMQPRAPNSLLAQQIAQQIAERRAKLTGQEVVASPTVNLEKSTSRATEGLKVESETQPLMSPGPMVFPPEPPVSPKAAPGVPQLEKLPSAAPRKLLDIPERLPSNARKTLQPPPTAPISQPRPTAPPSTPLPAPIAQAISAPSQNLAAAPAEASYVTSGMSPTLPAPMPPPMSPTLPMTAPIANGRNGAPVEVRPPTFLNSEELYGRSDIKEERSGAIRVIIATVILFGLVVLIFNPTVRNKVLPAPAAATLQKIPIKLGFEPPPPPPVPPTLLEFHQFAPGLKPTAVKEVNTVVVGGTVKNISSAPLRNIRAEIQLVKRTTEDTPPEIRQIGVVPVELMPGAEGRYVLEFLNKDYQSWKLTRLVLEDGSEAKSKELDRVAIPVELTTPPPDEKTSKAKK